MAMNNNRHPEVRAVSAFTRVFDALWRASKDARPTEIGLSDFGCFKEGQVGKCRLGWPSPFEGRFTATSG
jgi:hypothetical protein